MNQWRQLQFKTDSLMKEHADLQEEVVRARSKPIDPEIYKSIKESVIADAAARKASTPNLANLDRSVESVKTLGEEAQAKRAAYNAIENEINSSETRTQELRNEIAEHEKTAAASQVEVDGAKAEVVNEQAKKEAAEKKLEEAKKNSDADAIEAAETEIADSEVNIEIYGEIIAEEEKKVADAKAAAAPAEAKIKAIAEGLPKLKEQLVAADQEALAAEKKAAARRLEVLEEFDQLIAAARYREDLLLTERKFKSAQLDAKKAELGLAVRDEKDQEELDRLQGVIDGMINEEETGFAALTEKYQRASVHRNQLADYVATLRKDAVEVEMRLAKSQSDLDQLQKAYAQQQSTYFSSGYPLLGKKILELPILDAFNSPLKIENLWNEELTIDYNFSRVRRFDRCTTCHQMMDKTMPGSAVDAAYPEQKLITFIVPTPQTPEEMGEVPDAASEQMEQRVLEVYGLKLAAPGEGLIESDAVTLSFVSSNSRAARAFKAPTGKELEGLPGTEVVALAATDWMSQPNDGVANGLLPGDVIYEINGDYVQSREEAMRFMMNPVDMADERGKQLRVTVRRGLPEPFASHPRLDLFLGSLSPHPMSVYGCTSCHEGQGSATSFEWASHTPNSPKQAAEWSRELGWFDNHHWIYPMYPERFQQSSCLKCHHDVTELQASERFPDPPAPKVVHGHDVIQKFGCFGCHEINGYDGNKRIGPDMRLEPNVFAAAQEFVAAPNFNLLSEEEQLNVETLIHHPEDDSARRQVFKLLTQEGKAAVDDDPATEPRLTPNTIDLASIFKDSDTPGTLRRVGPSLRFVREKLGASFLFDWIRQPSNFRPTTRMPQFFGLTKHLHGEEEIETTENYEQVEILGAVAYLLHSSQKFEPLQPPAIEGDNRDETVRLENGKWLFQSRGCLACHSHEEFPDANIFRPADQIQQGPDLSHLAEKFAARGKDDVTAKGKSWLYSWIKRPTHYHVRTVMPDLFLDPYKDAEGVTIDPTSDIVDFLLHADGDSSHYHPVAPPAEFDAAGNLTSIQPATAKTLEELTLVNLLDAYFETQAKDYASHGIPAAKAVGMKGAEVELIVAEGEELTPAQMRERKLLYIGRKTIGKYGCYACHDIPGFEGAKPIGTGLADWGRKNTSQIAFEHIAQYLEHGHGHGAGHGAAAHGETSHQGDEKEEAATAPKMANHVEKRSGHAAEEDDPLPGFYEESLLGGHRIGFLYQKLREPRSYDYHKVGNKKYNERLRMPQFPFNQEEREAVITFVAGLVADPPTSTFVYTPQPREKAIQEGERVIEKFNCTGCHVMDLEQWKISYPPGSFADTGSEPTYPFLTPTVPDGELAASEKENRRGRVTSVLKGLLSLNDNTGLPDVYDSALDAVSTRPGSEERYVPYSLQYRLSLFEPAAIDGSVRPAATALTIPEQMVDARYAAHGGMLARYLSAHVRDHVANVKGSQAWERVPPPLMGEGKKVQTEWLHDFLLAPYPIRPLVVLRMPKFNMSSDEASILVNYFAAKDNVDYPYEYSPRQSANHLATAEEIYQKRLAELEVPDAAANTRLADGLKIVTNVCVQCHIVADFVPPDAKGPNLADVYKRMRPKYVLDWVANPARILPYTSMPVNIPYDPAKEFNGGVKQEFYHGTSTEQLEGLVDLLMNFDAYTQNQVEITPLVPKKLPDSPAPASGDSPAAGTETPEPAAETPAPADPEKPAAPADDDAKPAEDKPADDKPADDKPADDKPADDKPADAKPAAEKPADDKPAATTDEDSPKPASPATPAGEKPAAEPPAEPATAGAGETETP
ncbi:hypothetical protein [Lignipirellula cremea]|nr:hypothetical protein [Lignipirellula cremea]